MADYRAGYEAALMVVATAFGIPVVANGRRCTPGRRLAVSDHADYTLARLLQEREEEETHGKDR